MTNNQLTPENVTRYAKYGVDMMEWPDGGYVRYEDYAALAAELQERCKVERDTEPYGFTDGDRRGMIYKPEHSDRLSEPVPVYRHAQQPVVPEEMTAGIAVKHWQGGRGSIESFVAGCNFFRAAILSQK